LYVVIYEMNVLPVSKQKLDALCEDGFRLAVQILRHREDAMDAVHDSLQHWLDRPEAYDAARGAARTWFLTVIRNRCLDVLRRRRRQPRESSLLEELRVTENGPDEVSEVNELRTLVQHMLDGLEEPKKTIIILKDFQMLTYSEIAEVLSIPEGTVMSRLHRARLELRNKLVQHAPDTFIAWSG